MRDLSQRETDFLTDVLFFSEYDLKMLDEFFDYWSEKNKKGKMRWELEKTWDTKRRLQRWFNNQNKWNARSNTTPTNGNGNNKIGTSAARIEAARNW